MSQMITGQNGKEKMTKPLPNHRNGKATWKMAGRVKMGAVPNTAVRIDPKTGQRIPFVQGGTK